MILNLSDTVAQLAVDANIIQVTGSVHSAESRWSQVQRLTYQVWEYVVATIGKQMRSRKLLK